MRCGSRTLLHTCTIPDPLNHWCLRDWLWAFSSVLKLGNYRLSGLWDAKQQQFNFVFINLFYWHSWFTMLCWFLLYNKVIQLSVHSVVSDSVIPWTAACQAFLSITNSWSLSLFLWSPLWGSWWCWPRLGVIITSPTQYQLQDWFLLPFWKSKFIPRVFCSCWWSGTAVVPRLTWNNSLWWSQQNIDNTIRESRKTKAFMVFSH